MYEDIILNAFFVFQCFSILIYAKDRSFVAQKLTSDDLKQFKDAVRNTVDSEYA